MVEMKAKGPKPEKCKDCGEPLFWVFNAKVVITCGWCEEDGWCDEDTYALENYVEEEEDTYTLVCGNCDNDTPVVQKKE